MKRSLFATLLFLFMALFVHSQNPGNPDGYLRGYTKTIRGDDFNYHSPQPNVSSALLIRSLQQNLYVEWETELIPTDFKKSEARFIFLAAIDVNPQDPHSWILYINDKPEFTISSPLNGDKKQYSWKGQDGYILNFNVTITDQAGDQHGYMTLVVPVGKLEKGRPLRLKVSGESADSQTWFMIFKYGMEPDLKLVEEQAVRREGKNEFQQVRIEYVFMGESADVSISAGGIKTNSTLNFGYNIIRAKVPVVMEPRTFAVNLSLTKGNKILVQKDFLLTPVVQRTIHLLHHSHVDIGYTHIQDEVKQMQWKNLESAIKLASESKDYPEGAKFKWNSEVMWAIESYLREKEPEKAEALRSAISKGWIEPGALFANELTELCTSEELIRLTSDARRIAAECGVPLKSAMITDIPGWSWGIVPVLAQSGVRYLSLGVNSGDRIGGTIKEWGDRPFYWVSPSGEEKILCWIHQKGYSLFHTGLKYDELKYRLDEGKIFTYMNELKENKYPYEIIPLRYNIGSDNGPTDPTLSQAVMDWNEKYVTPKIKIMTVTESFSEFENRYGDQIPVVSGAFTGYWEDGAASSAYETSLNRQTAARINTADALMVMNNNSGFFPAKIDETWRNVLLYDEHTWGSWNSISDPESPFTISQWTKKKSFATVASKLSSELFEGSIPDTRRDAGKTVLGIEVINPHSWNFSDVVTIPAAMNIRGTKVVGKNGRTIPSQKLSSGETVFVAEDVPAFGSRIYSFEKEEERTLLPLSQANQIENEKFLLKVDPENGSVKSLIDKTRNFDLTDTARMKGLNSYFYVSGRSPENRTSSWGAKIEIKESGPVTKIIKATLSGNGSRSVTNYYQLFSGLEKILMISEIDKEKVYASEGVHLGFPFNIPDGVVHIDLAYGIYRPEADQINGACKNYFTPEKWVDISNQDFGVTFVTNDAPLIEIGDISTDANVCGWKETIKTSQTIYSYVMNNYWGTNYKAEQNGITSFRYILGPHRMFLPADAEKLASQESEPLIVVPLTEMKQESEPLFSIQSDGIIVTALIPLSDGYLIRLFNSKGAPENLNINWKEKPADVYFSDPDGVRMEGFIQGKIVSSWALRTLRVRR